MYLSNEAGEHVYFDNFKVTHNRGRIIEENHYYAYGLCIQAISSKKLGDASDGHLQNQHLYNDKELIEDGDLGWYDYGFRNYDPQIGRFPQLDPLTFSYPFYTPYQYAGCEPITNVDVDGLEPAGSVIGTAAQPVVMSDFTISITKSAATAAVLARTMGSGVSLLGTAANVGGAVGNYTGQQFANQAINKALQGAGWSEKALGFISRNAGTLARFGGTVAGVLSWHSAGANFPHGDENYYRYSPSQFIKQYPYDPLPSFLLGTDPALQMQFKSKDKLAKPLIPDDADDQFLYRGGAFSDMNFTPRPGKDDGTDIKSGLSTFTDPYRATQNRGGKVQVLSVKTLIKFGFHLNIAPDGHVGIRPFDQKELEEWAQSRNNLALGEPPHMLTMLLKLARVREVNVLSR